MKVVTILMDVSKSIQDDIYEKASILCSKGLIENTSTEGWLQEMADQEEKVAKWASKEGYFAVEFDTESMEAKVLSPNDPKAVAGIKWQEKLGEISRKLRSAMEEND